MSNKKPADARARPPVTSGLRGALVAVLALALPLQAWSADCGVDGTLVRDAATRGIEAASRTVNMGAMDIMTAAQSRSSCLERFGVQTIGSGGGIVSSLANAALESACNQARGAAGRYLQQASSVASGAIPSVGGVSLPSLGGMGNPAGAIMNAGMQQVQQQVQQQAQQAQQGVWQRMQCWVTGC